MSFKKYRAIDLAIMAFILVIVEAVAATAARSWFPMQSFTVSPITVVLCIVMMRWGGFAAIHAIIGGLAFCIASGATPEQFAIYCVGNCFALAALLFFKFLGKEKVRSRFYLTAVFTVAVFCLEQVGRWVVSLFFGGKPEMILAYFGADTLSLLFAVVVVLISRNIDGLFEDQKSYLIRTEKERLRQQSDLDEF